MGLKDSIRVVQAGGRRIKIFVDFWNVVIMARQQAKMFDVEVRWDTLADLVLGETHRGYGDETSGELAGCYIFGSQNRSDPRQMAFIERTLDKFGPMPGLFFEFKERVRKETSDRCGSCGERIDRISELGVDVLLSVEMIKHALMREHEYLAIVSSDRDYIPLLAYLKDQGQRVLHVATGKAHRDMRSLTWKQVELAGQYYQLYTIAHEDFVIFTTPQYEAAVEFIKRKLESRGLPYRIIDVTEPDQIADKDFQFLLSNQLMYFRTKEGNPNQSFGWSRLFKTVYELRAALREGALETPFPYVLCNGRLEVKRDRQHGWVTGGASEAGIQWRETD